MTTSVEILNNEEVHVIIGVSASPAKKDNVLSFGTSSAVMKVSPSISTTPPNGSHSLVTPKSCNPSKRIVSAL